MTWPKHTWFLPRGRAVVQLCLIGSLLAPLGSPTATAGESAADFRAVLELANLGPEVLAQLSDGPEYQDADWRILSQLLYRLRQYPASQLDRWTSPAMPDQWLKDPGQYRGSLFDVTGTVESVQPVAMPENLVQLYELSTVYRCRFHFEEAGADGVVLTPRIPSRWKSLDSLQQPVRFRGVFLRLSKDEDRPSAVLLTDHLAWRPRKGESAGLLLLARQGMDVALLDEVEQRSRFVSSEGDAFYECLAALKRTDDHELRLLAQKNLEQVLQKWRARQTAAEKQCRALREKLAATTDDSQRKALRKDLEAAHRRQLLAAAVLQQGALGLSSVAPLFLQPDQEVGELVHLEGIARRAVRIVAGDGFAGPVSGAAARLGIDAYYELEVFTADSQNLPIVCCVNRLPANFPTGDAIREPISVAGVFFKSWLFRSRQVVDKQPGKSGAGQTGRQQRLYTPLVVGGTPTWLTQVVSNDSRWGLWGGVAFLVLLVGIWIHMARLEKRDREERAAAGEVKFNGLAHHDKNGS